MKTWSLLQVVCLWMLPPLGVAFWSKGQLTFASLWPLFWLSREHLVMLRNMMTIYFPNLLVFPQSLQFKSSDKLYTAKFVRLCSTSQTDLRRNCNSFGSIDFMSFQVIFRCLAAVHFIQFPCFFMPTAFTIIGSSSITCTFFSSSFFSTSLSAVSNPSLPTSKFPTMSAFFMRNSASRTISWTKHSMSNSRYTLSLRTFSSLLC